MGDRYHRITGDVLPVDQIEPGRWYSVREACRYLPSPSGKGCLQKEALRDRAGRGEIKMEKFNGYWWVWGAELLRHARMPKGYQLPPDFRSPTEMRRGHEAAMKEARRLGIID